MEELSLSLIPIILPMPMVFGGRCRGWRTGDGRTIFFQVEDPSGRRQAPLDRSPPHILFSPKDRRSTPSPAKSLSKVHRRRPDAGLQPPKPKINRRRPWRPPLPPPAVAPRTATTSNPSTFILPSPPNSAYALYPVLFSPFSPSY